ncbi:MAG: DUF3050 domain-containing protein [Planctomycetaceae bacterium]|nr:DUF3050 domain-containing protein [Planctomycetaceae bacterium]
MSRWEEINRRLEPLRAELLESPLYGQIRDLPALHRFMEFHVFAVWDFMSLLKSLQRSLCCVDVPWAPPSDTRSARLINEIVLAEETDEIGEGEYDSHFGMYLAAMEEAGASTGCIREFLDGVSAGREVGEALLAAEAPAAVLQFVTQTFATIRSGDLPAIAAAFTFGREDLLPALFTRIVRGLNEAHAGRLGRLVIYLERHIELDGDTHGPLARRLVESICGHDSEKWASAERGAIDALQARLKLWNGIRDAIAEGESAIVR